MPLSPLNYQNISTWFNNHVELGGSVYRSELSWDFLPSPEDDINNLFDKVKNVDFENILAFQEAEITDNSMPYRDVLEDCSKIFYLRDQISNGNLIFNPQILHEPWYDRYRVHPGSGRLAASWLSGVPHITCLYTHFDEPGFKIPPASIALRSVDDIIDSILATDDDVTMDIETYTAFPTSTSDAQSTAIRDSEWEYDNIQTTAQWQFLRYSEGTDFLTYKHEWRSRIIEVWDSLQ